MPSRPRDVGVLIVAAGASRRLPGRVRKPFLKVGGVSLLARSLKTFAGFAEVAQIVLVVRSEDRSRAARAARACRIRKGIRLDVIQGGAQRPDSVGNGLGALVPGVRWVAVHDAARPFASARLIRAVLAAARRHGGAIPAIPVSDTLKRVEKGLIRGTVDRAGLWAAQTPQIFRRDRYLSACNRRKGRVWTDDALAFESAGYPVAVVPGERSNLKVTTAEDLAWARFFSDSAKEKPGRIRQ